MKALALVTARRPEEADLLEFLRIVAALVACDVPVRLGELEEVAGALSGDDLPDEAERILEQLATLGVGPEVLRGAGLRRALEEATTLLRLAVRDRSGAPAVLDLADGDAPQGLLTNAGQVVIQRVAKP